MTHGELFDNLDLERDGVLGRDELYRAACRFGWRWHEAPFYALVDFLTIHAPLSREEFVTAMDLVDADPDGIYGSVLERFTPHGVLERAGRGRSAVAGGGRKSGDDRSPVRPENRLRGLLDAEAAAAYGAAITRLDAGCRELNLERAALLLIDPQRSFTCGDWMWRLGAAGVSQVMPIVEAMHVCAELLASLAGRLELMCTRCPFPPPSYGWDDSLQTLLPPDQHYFIKPGNSVLTPAGNGFHHWLRGLLEEGRDTLVMGGCTLNSCVRISALETLRAFREQGLRVVVDLSLCGARADNYQASDQFGGRSAVEAALEEMAAGGVLLTEGGLWR